MASPARSGYGLVLRTLGLIILGGVVLIGLAPRPLTFTVLGLLLSAGFATFVLWARWRWYRFGLRPTNGRLPLLIQRLTEGALNGMLPLLIQSLLGGALGVVVDVKMIGALLSGAFTNPPITSACLCTRVGGLATAGWYGVGLLVVPGMIALGILLIEVAVTQTGFALVAAWERLRRRGQPRPDDSAPSR